MKVCPIRDIKYSTRVTLVVTRAKFCIWRKNKKKDEKIVFNIFHRLSFFFSCFFLSFSIFQFVSIFFTSFTFFSSFFSFYHFFHRVFFLSFRLLFFSVLNADIKEKIDIVITSSTEQNIQPFKSISEELVRNASSKIDNQYHELDACKVIFRETLDYFKHIPKTGTIDECTPSQFFELWVNFCIDFRDLWRKEISVINAEM